MPKSCPRIALSFLDVFTLLYKLAYTVCQPFYKKWVPLYAWIIASAMDEGTKGAYHAAFILAVVALESEVCERDVPAGSVEEDSCCCDVFTTQTVHFAGTPMVDRQDTRCSFSALCWSACSTARNFIPPPRFALRHA